MRIAFAYAAWFVALCCWASDQGNRFLAFPSDVSTTTFDTDGFLVCDDLMPQKARILLMLALTITRERSVIQKMFYEY